MNDLYHYENVSLCKTIKLYAFIYIYIYLYIYIYIKA